MPSPIAEQIIYSEQEILNDVYDAVNHQLKSSSSGGSSGGTTSNSLSSGPGIFSNIFGDFTATVNVGTKTITLSAYASTLLSAVINTKTFINAVVRRINASGAIDTLPVTTVSYAANVITLTGMTANFASGDLVVILLQGPVKAYDSTNDAGKTIEQFVPQYEDNTNQVAAVLQRPVASSTYSAPLPFISFGTTVAISVKATPGNVLSIVASNKNAALRYLQIHNKASAPATSDVPILSLPIGAGSATNPIVLSVGRDILGQGGKYCSTGVAIGISTTEATFTAATTTDHDIYGEAV